MREYFVFYTNPLIFKIVDSIEREETEGEKSKRIQIREEYISKMKFEMKKKNPSKVINFKNSKTQLIKLEPEIEETKYFSEPKPSNINMKDNLCIFFKWIASQLQLIKDLKITDCNVNLFILT